MNRTINAAIGVNVYLPAKCHEKMYFQKLFPEETDECVYLRQEAYEKSWEIIQHTATRALEKENRNCFNGIIDMARTLTGSPVSNTFATAVLFTENHDASLWTKPLLSELHRHTPFVPVLKSSDFTSSAKHVVNVIATQFEQMLQRRDTEENWLATEYERHARDGMLRNLRPTRVSSNSTSRTSKSTGTMPDRTTQEIIGDLEFQVEHMAKSRDNLSMYVEIYQQNQRDQFNKQSNIHSMETYMSIVKNTAEQQSHNVELKTMFTRLLTEFEYAIVDRKRRHARSSEMKHIEARLEQLKYECDQMNEIKLLSVLPIIVEDFEAIPARAFSDFLSIINGCSKNVPILFIMAITSESSPNYRRMPAATSTQLDINTFHLADAPKCVETILKGLCFTKTVPVNLSGEIITWLKDVYFRELDFSIPNLLKVLRYSMMQHFSKTPFSFLTLKRADQTPIAQHFKSFQSGDVTECIDQLWNAKIVNGVLFDCFRSLVSSNTAWSMLFALLDHTTSRSESELLNRIGRIPLPDLNRIVDGWCSAIQSLKISEIMTHGDNSSLWQMLRPLWTELEKMSEFLNCICREDDAAMIQQMSTHVRNDVIRLVEDHMLPLFSDNRKHPLHELMLFDDFKIIRETFCTPHRKNITSQMSHPYETLKTRKKRILDIEIVYKIYASHAGSQVEVADWFTQFKSKIKSKSDDNTILTRFVRCVSTMRAMGFIKESGKSRKYVKKLLWT